MACNPDKMGFKSSQFGKYYPHRLCSLRHLYSKQFFYRQNVAQVIAHGSQIVQSVGQWQRLVVCTMFGQLLNTAMEISNVWRYLLDHFAIKFDDHPQHAMGTGMLRPHIYCHYFFSHHSPRYDFYVLCDNAVRTTDLCKVHVPVPGAGNPYAGDARPSHQS